MRADLVRVKISRGGVFDESPTYAVCVDPLAEPVAFEVVRGDDAVRVLTSGLVLTLWLDPFRIDLHRPDGSVVVETAADADGRYWAYATLDDDFTVRRRVGAGRRGLGAGREVRPGQPQGPRLHAVEHRRAQPRRIGGVHVRARPRRTRGRSRRARSSTRSTSPSRSTTSRTAARGRWRAPSSTTAIAPTTTSPAPDEYRLHASGGQYTEYLFAGPGMPEILAAYTWLTGRTAPPPLWSLGYHQCRWYAYTQDTVEALASEHRDRGIPCDALWLDIDYMDGYRVFTWDAAKFPDPAGTAGAACRAALPAHHDHRPGHQARPGLPDLRPGGRARRAVPDRERRRSTSGRSGRATPSSPTSPPRRRAPGGASSTPRTSRRGWPASGTT